MKKLTTLDAIRASAHITRTAPMADYFFKTVIEPPIPIGDMTPLEALLLCTAFEYKDDAGARYFFASEGPATVNVPICDLHAALAATPEEDGSIRAAVAELLSCAPEAWQDLDVDFDGEEIEATLQNIVRRSKTLTEIVVTTSFTCSRPRPNGFGGAVTLITAAEILSGSTRSLLQEFRNRAAQSAQTALVTPTPAIVHVACYEHPHGTHTRVFTTADAAKAWRHEIAAEWWDQEIPDRIEKPVDPNEQAEVYFDHVGEHRGEYFSITTANLEGPPPAPAQTTSPTLRPPTARSEATPHNHFAVTVETFGEEIVRIETASLSGREPSPEDEATIRLAAAHLLAFVGDPAPERNPFPPDHDA